MTRKERLTKEIGKLRDKEAAAVRTGMFTRAFDLSRRIAEMQKEIDAADAEAARVAASKGKPLTEILTREELREMRLIPRMIECHLICDLLADATYQVLDVCREKGLEVTSFAPELREINRRAQVFANRMSGMSDKLCDLMVRNETLLKTLHGKIQKYIEQRLGKDE